MKRWAGQFQSLVRVCIRIPCFNSTFLPCFWSDIVTHLALFLSIIDYSQDHMELGAVWNGFSLNESGELAAAIEKTGRAIDTTYMNTARLVSWDHVIRESNAL
jgi:hypothetical protein